MNPASYRKYYRSYQLHTRAGKILKPKGKRDLDGARVLAKQLLPAYGTILIIRTDIPWGRSIKEKNLTGVVRALVEWWTIEDGKVSVHYPHQIPNPRTHG